MGRQYLFGIGSENLMLKYSSCETLPLELFTKKINKAELVECKFREIANDLEKVINVSCG